MFFKEPNLDRFNDDAFRNFGRSRSSKWDEDAYDSKRDRELEESYEEENED